MGIKNTKPIQIIQKVMQNDYVRNDSWLTSELQAVLARLGDNTFKVAVVGEFSSGKSTFLNALIGKDILKHGVNETTATITEIVNDIHEGKTEIHFTNGQVKTLLSYKNLDMGKYTTTDKSEYDVATQIDRVVIHKHVISTNQSVVFIDTPGLNGMADHHREKTINIIKNAHACIFLLQARGLSDSDVAFIKLLSRYQSDFIFVQNFIDTLLAAEGETPDQKIAGQKAILDKVFAGQKDVQYMICGVSALQALQAADPSVRDTKLTDTEVKQLQRESRMDTVRQKIKELMDANQKNQRQQKAAIAVAIQRLSSSAETLAEQKSLAELDWQQSLAGQSEAKRKQFITLLEQRQSDHKTKIRNFVTSEASKINRQTNQLIEEKVELLMPKFTKEINDFSDVDAIDRYVKNRVFESNINRDVALIESQVEDYLNNSYAHLYDNAFLRVKQYASSDFNGDITIGDFSKRSLSGSFQFHDNTGINQTQNELEAAQRDQEWARRERVSEEQNQRDYVQKINSVNRDKGNLNNQLEADRRRLGPRPNPKTFQKEEIYYRKRKGLFSSFTNFFAGDKKDTRWVTYTDDSEGEDWDRRNAQCWNEYNRKWDSLDSTESTYRRKLSKVEDKLRRIQDRESVAAQNVRYLQDKLTVQIRQNEEAKRMATIEFLNNIKRELQRSLQEYASKAKINLTSRAASLAKEYSTTITNDAVDFYTKLITSRIDNLRHMTGNAEEKEHIRRYERNKATIDATIRELEAYV